MHSKSEFICASLPRCFFWQDDLSNCSPENFLRGFHCIKERHQCTMCNESSSSLFTDYIKCQDCLHMAWPGARWNTRWSSWLHLLRASFLSSLSLDNLPLWGNGWAPQISAVIGVHPPFSGWSSRERVSGRVCEELQLHVEATVSDCPLLIPRLSVGLRGFSTKREAGCGSGTFCWFFMYSESLLLGAYSLKIDISSWWIELLFFFF